MIKVKVIHTKGKIREISISGHADYDEYGNDIVCAAISSTVITTVNGIMKYDSSLIDFKQTQDELQIKVLKENPVEKVFLTNMLDLLEELETQYTENIKIIK